MRVLILGAGYATRLYPLTLHCAKPLLEVAGRPMIDRVLDKVLPIPGIDRVQVVTNARFHGDFLRWADTFRAGHPGAPPLDILNDGSSSEDDRLGAIGDMHLAVHTGGPVRDGVLVVAGDNLFSESLEGFGRAATRHPAVVALYDVGDLGEVRKYNNVSVDAAGIITHFEEKPAEPTGTLTAIALYYYSAEVLPLLDRYVADGANRDEPGRFVQWLYARVPVFTCVIGGLWFDIGSRETLERADAAFRSRAG